MKRKKQRLGVSDALLEETARYKAIGQMIGGFVHQLRTPIHIIQSSAEEILRSRGLFHNPKPQLEMIQRSVSRMESSVQALLNFVKGEKPRLVPGTINTVVDQLGDFLKEECRKRKITIEKDLRSQQFLRLDAHHLQEAILNVLTNALQAMPRGGMLTLHSEDMTRPKRVVLEIRDTGAGMDKKTLERVKIPFTTTKKTGFGLGLYFTRKILQQHRAGLAMTSVKGKGTTVTMSFPAA
jgi:two-component system sensor histidine kinase HydH